ncbi:MAG: hypothetical protein WCT77_00270 [Bacteroidota bacterium]
MANNITWDSVPIFDGWGWDDHWTLNDWVTWHKALRVKYSSDNKTKKDSLGREWLYNLKADPIWINQWRKQSFGAEPTNSIYNTQSDAFKYIKQHIYLYVITGAITQDHNLSNPTAVKDTLTDVAQGVGDAIESAADTITTGYKILKYGAIGLIALAVIGGSVAIYYKIKTIKKLSK